MLGLAWVLRPGWRSSAWVLRVWVDVERGCCGLSVGLVALGGCCALGDQDAAARRGGRQGPFRHGQGATFFLFFITLEPRVE